MPDAPSRPTTDAPTTYAPTTDAPTTYSMATDALADRARQHPDRAALVFEGRITNFATLDRHAGQVARALRASGIAAGERVAYVGRNTDVFFELLYGAMQAGIVAVPINWRLAGPEIAAIVADAGARLIVAGAEYTGLVAAMLPNLARETLVIDAEATATATDPAWPAFAAWRDAQPVTPPHFAKPDWAKPAANGIAIQLYTSGTTGLPKGVMLSHANMVDVFAAGDRADLDWNRWHDDDVALLAMPVSHVSGSGWGIAAMYHGATCHIQRQFDLELTLDMIAHDRISKIFLVPAALQALVRHPRARTIDYSRIREMGYGASPMPLPLLRECMDVIGPRFVQFYGMTETTGTIVALPPQDHRPEGTPRMRAAGLPLPWVELKIVNANDEEVPRGTVGELITRSPANMVGYWNRPEETAKTIRDGWLHTGDAGYMDAEGYVFIHDRVKDMIISGGENVYPAEVENALSEHPAIAEVAVIGVPDETWGEAVKAIVVLRPGTTLTQDELIDWSRARIAGFKTPKSVDFAAVLPRNATGKLLKRELRAPFWEGRTRQVN